MARTPINQGVNETATALAANLMVAGNLDAINKVPAASQGEAWARFQDRRDAGECRWSDIVKTPPLPSGFQ